MNVLPPRLPQGPCRAAAAAVAGIELPASAANLITEAGETALTWSKAPCRFCGTGCSVMVATKDGRVVATHGDIKSPVNRGLNCVKGYFLSKIMYGEDRLTTPLLRMKDGRFDKNGELHGGQLGPGLRHHGGEVQAGAARQGPERCRHVRLRPVDGVGGLCRLQAAEGRASAPTTSSPTPGTAWRRRSRASCAPSAWTSRWAATTTSSRPTRSCCGARTWPRCTRSCGPG